MVVEEARAQDQFFIAQRVMPPMPVAAKSGTYPKLKVAESELATAASSIREAGGAYNRIMRQWVTDTYDCVDRGLEELVDDANAKDVGRFFSLEATTSRLIYRNVQMDYEKRVAAATFNTTTYGSATNSAVAYTAANLATIDFPQDVMAAIERVAANGAQANTIVMSQTVFNRLCISTKLQTYLRGSLTGQLTTAVTAGNIAAAFADNGISQVLIGRLRENTATKGQSKSMGGVWNNTYIWVGQVNTGAAMPQDGGAGFTFYWNAEGGLFVTETYRADDRRSNVLRVRQNVIEKVTDATAGTLIATQYS